MAHYVQAVQHLLKEKEHKHDYTVLIVVSVISVLVLLLMTYGIVSFCVKNHCRIRQYGHIYDLGTSELFDLYALPCRLKGQSHSFLVHFANIANIKCPSSEWNLASMTKLLVNYKITALS